MAATGSKRAQAVTSARMVRFITVSFPRVAAYTRMDPAGGPDLRCAGPGDAQITRPGDRLRAF
jgi:hypothetical protein